MTGGGDTPSARYGETLLRDTNESSLFEVTKHIFHTHERVTYASDEQYSKTDLCLLYSFYAKQSMLFNVMTGRGHSTSSSLMTSFARREARSRQTVRL